MKNLNRMASEMVAEAKAQKRTIIVILTDDDNKGCNGSIAANGTFQDLVYALAVMARENEDLKQILCLAADFTNSVHYENN